MCMNRACLRRDDPGSQARFDETMRRDSVNPSDLRRCRPRMRTTAHQVMGEKVWSVCRSTKSGKSAN